MRSSSRCGVLLRFRRQCCSLPGRRVRRIGGRLSAFPPPQSSAWLRGALVWICDGVPAGEATRKSIVSGCLTPNSTCKTFVSTPVRGPRCRRPLCSGSRPPRSRQRGRERHHWGGWSARRPRCRDRAVLVTRRIRSGRIRCRSRCRGMRQRPAHVAVLTVAARMRMPARSSIRAVSRQGPASCLRSRGQCASSVSSK